MTAQPVSALSPPPVLDAAAWQARHRPTGAAGQPAGNLALNWRARR